jgi:hypothetical protein
MKMALEAAILRPEVSREGEWEFEGWSLKKVFDWIFGAQGANSIDFSRIIESGCF